MDDGWGGQSLGEVLSRSGRVDEDTPAVCWWCWWTLL